MLHLEHRYLWCSKLNTLENRMEIPRIFWYVVLKKDGDQLDRLCEKLRIITWS
jgi:hypothetical protein